MQYFYADVSSNQSGAGKKTPSTSRGWKKSAVHKSTHTDIAWITLKALKQVEIIYLRFLQPSKVVENIIKI